MANNFLTVKKNYFLKVEYLVVCYEYLFNDS